MDARAFLIAQIERTTLYPDHPFNVTHDGKLSGRTTHAFARNTKAWFNWLVMVE